MSKQGSRNPNPENGAAPGDLLRFVVRVDSDGDLHVDQEVGRASAMVVLFHGTGSADFNVSFMGCSPWQRAIAALHIDEAARTEIRAMIVEGLQKSSRSGIVRP